MKDSNKELALEGLLALAIAIIGSGIFYGLLLGWPI